MKRLFPILFLTLVTLQLSAQKLPKGYTSTMNWLTEQSNAYSGALNPRQTWDVSFDGYKVTEQYFWDNELTVCITFDIRNMKNAKIEKRFTNSIVLYPKNGNIKHFEVIRYEEGKAGAIEGEYYNLMVYPEKKKETLAKMEKVLTMLK